MRSYALALIISLSVACTAQAPGGAPPSTGELKALLDADWSYWMAQHPELATAFGHPGRHAGWTDYSAAAIAARAAYVRSSAQKLAAIDRGALTAADQLNLDLYKDIVDAAVAGLAWDNEPVPIRGVIPHNLRMPMNQLEGLAQDVPLVISQMPAASVADYEDIVKSLDAVPALVDQTIALMEQGMKRGWTPPKITFRDVPSQVQGQIVDATKSPLLDAFRKIPAAIGAADQQRLVTAAEVAFNTHTKPAFQKLFDFLTTTYLPACRETTSVTALDGGARMYAYNVGWHTTSSETPQQIHEIGLAEVKRIRAAMDAVITETKFKGSFADFATFLRTSPQFFYKDAPSLLTGYRDITKRIEPELARLFGRLPQTPYGVAPVPDAIAPSQTTGYYQPGSLKAGRAGNFFANTYKLDMRPRWEMEALTMHEAVPGHHLQIAIGQELEGLPAFRNNSSYTAFVEGWALYSQSLGYEMGFYKDPYAKFGQLTYDMWRAVRLVVDTGLHSMNWTRDQAIEFFASNTPKTRQDITVEVDRYIVWPGQALGYKMGQLKIRALRTKAEQKLGAKFDVRGFHDLVLSQGALPMAVLEQRVDEWIRMRLTS